MKGFRLHALRAGWSAEEIARATTEPGMPVPIVDFVAEAERCPVCGGAVRILKSRFRLRPVMSCKAGPFIPRVVLKRCQKDPSHPVVYSQALARIVRPLQRYGY
ncbi:MAG: hypothetical protein GY807_18805, partial [Gammaproteobacteria bacterium]|nr:hypothetical protein [Gammaproteobacteria bacterium]